MTTEKRQRNGVPGAIQFPRAEKQYAPQSPSRARTRFITVDHVIFDVNNASVLPSVYMTKAAHTARVAHSASRASSPASAPDDAPNVALRDAPHQLPEQVPSGVLEIVLKYCYFHTSRKRAKMKAQTVRDWDEDYVRVDPRRLCELASAAYYLEIPHLVELTCRAIANIISGKDSDQIRDTFQIENDFLERLLPTGNGGSSARRNLLSGRAGQRRNASAQPFQPVSKKPHTFSLADIDDFDHQDSDDNVPANHAAHLSVAEAVEWIESTDNSKKAGRKRKKKRGKNKGSSEPNDASAPPQNHVRTISSRSSSQEPPVAEGTIPDGKTNGHPDKQTNGHEPSPSATKATQQSPAAAASDVINLISSDDEILPAAREASDTRDFSLSGDLKSENCRDKCAGQGSESAEREQEGKKFARVRRKVIIDSPQPSSSSGSPSPAVQFSFNSNPDPLPRSQTSRPHIKIERPSSGHERLYEPAAVGAGISSRGASELARVSPAVVGAVDERTEKEHEIRNVGNSRQDAGLSNSKKKHSNGRLADEQRSHIGVMEADVEPSSDTSQESRPSENPRSTSKGTGTMAQSKLRETSESHDEERNEAQQLASRHRELARKGSAKCSTPNGRPSKRNNGIPHSVVDSAADASPTHRNAKNHRRSTPGNPVSSPVNHVKPAFIHCPEQMNREVEDFEKRLIGEGAAPSDERPPSESKEAQPMEGKRTRVGKDMHSVPTGAEHEEKMESDSSHRDDNPWQKKIEEARLSEREVHLKHSADSIEQQVAALNSQREEIRDGLAQVRIELSQIRSSVKRNMELGRDTVNLRLQQARLSEREANFIQLAGSVRKQINTLNGQKEEVLDRLVLAQMQLSKLKSE